MNILQAKEEVKRTIEIYLEKDEYGEYRIPYMKQRPVFLLGAPGIGKTAIIEQVAEETDLGLIVYSMTHHTRQSAVGLPFINTREYDGRESRVTEYTMSEIIASVYEMMENTGKRQGILFLDEINCVSETLSPSILQFLQYKSFGNRRIPAGWVIITAGNPPEYNRSVREFDIATRDRLKLINIEDDYHAWKTYAYERGIHSSILSFLELNQTGFYTVRMTADGAQYATARGWEDLSYAIRQYEYKDFPIELPLIQQYITDNDISRKYAVYYELYAKYKRDYKIDRLLTGKWTKDVQRRAKDAGFDERIAVIEMLYEALNNGFEVALRQQSVLEKTSGVLKDIRTSIYDENADSKEASELLLKRIINMKEECRNQDESKSLSAEDKKVYIGSENLLYRYLEIIKESKGAKKAFTEIRKSFDALIKEQTDLLHENGDHLEHVFAFLEEVWVTGREMMYFMTILTTGKLSSAFIALHGSEGYARHNEQMLLYDAKDELKTHIIQNL